MSADTHTPPFTLGKFGINTHAYWSLNPSGRLLVLVHGFNGNAETTWQGLPNELILQTDAKGHDIISFGYNSVEQSAGESAMQLQIFLDKLFMDTARVINRSLDDNGSSLRRLDNWKYSHAVLVGHSLGACVARRTLLNQIQSGKNKWTPEIKLVWFAPAHRGAKLKLLIDAVALLLFGRRVKAVDDTVKFNAPSLVDLETDSVFLRELHQETNAICDAHPSLKAPKTFWALGDRVVNNWVFSKDVSPYEFVEGSDHVSICKFSGYDKRVGQLLVEMNAP